jgi:predicted enzyme related to lactoylglutathione lyase
MAVLRIVADIETPDVAGLRQFYRALFDLDVAMDLGWIVTLSGVTMPVQLSLASEGGSGAPVPDLSIEVDDVEAIFRRAKEQGAPIVYDLTDEPWGVRRFFLRDPADKLLNVLAHWGWGNLSRQ